MKIVNVTIGGAATEGDSVELYYEGPRGGKSEAGYVVRKGDDLAAIAAGLAGSVNHRWIPGKFQAEAKGADISIACADEVSDVKVTGASLGAGTETVTIA